MRAHLPKAKAPEAAAPVPSANEYVALAEA